MPIYATVCGACGNRKDVLVRSHDTPLPACTKEHWDGPCTGHLAHAVSAPTFHLKGTGWYRPGASK